MDKDLQNSILQEAHRLGIIREYLPKCQIWIFLLEAELCFADHWGKAHPTDSQAEAILAELKNFVKDY